MKKKKKPYWEMNTQELREGTKEFDEEFVALKAVPLTPKMKAKWLRAKKKVGRPPVGLGAAKIRISLERSLLQQTDSLAKRTRISRSELIARSLRAALSAA